MASSFLGWLYTLPAWSSDCVAAGIYAVRMLLIASTDNRQTVVVVAVAVAIVVAVVAVVVVVVVVCN